MASELFAKLTDLIERGDTAGCIAAVREATNAKDLQQDSDEILALVIHSDLQLSDEFDELVSEVSATGSAKTNLLSLLGGFSSSNGPDRVSRLFPAVAATLSRISEGPLRDKMAAFALSKAASYLRRLSWRIPEMPRTSSASEERVAFDAGPDPEAAVMDYAADMEAQLISPLILTMKTNKRHLANTLTHVFRFALAPCNMHRRERTFVPRALTLAETYLASLRALNADPVKLLAEAEDKVEDEEEEEEAVLSWVSKCGVGVMLYAIYAESVAPDVVPRNPIL